MKPRLFRNYREVIYPERRGPFSTIGELGMFTNKLNLVVPLTFAVLGLTAASIEPALAR